MYGSRTLYALAALGAHSPGVEEPAERDAGTTKESTSAQLVPANRE
jgi:hypothetical protein